MTRANAAITIAALAAVLVVALMAASPAPAACTPTGSNLSGTSGNDVLCGTSGPDTLFGQDGNDQLFGSFGADTLDGGIGDDLVDGGSGNDRLTGGSGKDIFAAGPGNDSLSGGDGDDHLGGEQANDLLIGGPGIDRFQGGSGNDILLARDGTPDAFTHSGCGSETDSLDMDLLDVAVLGVGSGLLVGQPLLFLSCENITIGAVNEGPNVKISRHSVGVGEDGRAAVRLRCPASLTAPCAGKLSIGRTKNSVGTPKAYSIDQGKKETVSARLSQRDRNKLSQRGRITASVTSVEQGQFGDKTTVQTIKLIAQD